MRKIDNFYSNNFDLLRLISAIFVLVSHCYELLNKLAFEPLYFASSGLLRFSTVGLYSFFFISGYLVSRSFYKTESVKLFVWKRFLRIYPALIFTVIITVFIIAPAFTNETLTAYFLNIGTYKYLVTISGLKIEYFLPGVFQNIKHTDHGVNGSLWSISLELKLYISLILFASVNRPRKKILCIIPLILSIIFTCLVQINYWHLQNSFDELHCRLIIIFFIGYVCSVYYRSFYINWTRLLILLFTYFLSLIYFNSFRFIIEPFFFAFLILQISYLLPVQKLTMDISYGIYIYAFLVTQLVLEIYRFINPVSLILIVMLVVFPLSIFSWTFIESRALKYKSKPL